MYLFHVLRSFLPMHNPIGFGGSDFIFFALALLAGAAGRWHAPGWRRRRRRWRGAPAWSMLLLAVLVVVLRLALLPVHPVPTASGADDFSFLLLGDTLRPFSPGQSGAPAASVLRNHVRPRSSPATARSIPWRKVWCWRSASSCSAMPWAGVLLSMGVLCALCYWMLRGWTSPGWALAGGLLAVCQFGPLNAWMNCYWGGAPSAIAGCLVFGALPRLSGPAARTWPAVGARFELRDALLLGLGLGIQMLSRPFESVFLDLSAVLFFLPELRRPKEWPQLGRAARVACPAVRFPPAV